MLTLFKKKKPKKDQLYFIWFDSGNRNYFSFGKDLEVMADNIRKKYNRYCAKECEFNSLEEMARDSWSTTGDWQFRVYIVNINSASDDDYRDFENEIYLGDYLEVIRERKLEV